MKSAKYTGQLYQFSTKTPLGTGNYVAVNGPWDTFGTVVSSTAKEDGSHLNLIRGCRPKIGERPVASF
jgi:hypothetical protein